MYDPEELYNQLRDVVLDYTGEEVPASVDDALSIAANEAIDAMPKAFRVYAEPNRLPTEAHVVIQVEARTVQEAESYVLHSVLTHGWKVVEVELVE